MIEGYFILGIALIASVFIYVRSLKSYNVKPRIAFAQVSVMGKTEDNEQVHITSTIFMDDTPEEEKAKLDRLYKLREDRLKFQNERMQELQKEIKEVAEKERARILEEEKAGVTQLYPKKV